jgi:hypothetical protein
LVRDSISLIASDIGGRGSCAKRPRARRGLRFGSALERRARRTQGQRQQPGALDAHALAHQAASLNSARTAASLRRIAAVERRERVG